MLTVFYDSYSVLNKVYSENAYISQAISSTKIEPLKKKMIIKLCYGVLDKDIELSYYIKCLSEHSPKLAVRTLLKIALYSIIYLKKQPFTVVNTTVELAKKLGKGGMAGFINACLRNFTRKEIPLPTEKYENLSIKYSYPVFAIKMLEKTYGLETAKEIIACDDEHSFARFNDGFDAEEYLKAKEIEYQKTPFNDLFDVKGLAINQDFEDGIFTFQSIGSRAICEIAKNNGKVLDACSAPGGKAVFLSKYAESVTAFELHAHRVELINSYAKRMKATNIEAIQKDSSKFDVAFENAFDLVLCDVPCSGFGTIKDNPDIKLKKEKEDVLSIVKTQSDILSTSSKYVKAGGYLVYSTCSIFKEENDDVVKKFLAKNAEFSMVEISCELDGLKTEYGLQFLPNKSFGAGFYVCKLRKN